MELIEMIGWVALGFIPALACLEASSKMLKLRSAMTARTLVRTGEKSTGL